MNALRTLLAIAASAIAVYAQADIPAQKSASNGVTVTATPSVLSALAEVWIFTVALDTHSVELSDDLASTAVLVDDSGRVFKPIAYSGAAPGGHHREGLLKFRAIEPRPGAIELRMTRPGEAVPRVFRWQVE